jgi:peptide-methionine (S)-S-oxide reductase
MTMEVQRATVLCHVIGVVVTTATALAALLSCSPVSNQDIAQHSPPAARPVQMTTDSELAMATFGSGCFWCTEAVFQQLRGVQRVVSGYAGGHKEYPSYEEVCSGTTGHAEVIQLTYDPKVVTYEKLLEVFWKSHDPTTPNRQGNDLGPQYRSIILYHDHAQKELAELYREKLDKSGAFDRPVVTQIVPYSVFFPAENDHQEYFRRNPRQPYCAAIIGPKVEKIRQVFAQDVVVPEP